MIAGASWGKPAFEENDLGYASLAEIAPLERGHKRWHRLFGRLSGFESSDGEMRLETTAFRPETVRLHRLVRSSLQAAELVGNGIDANPNNPRTLRVGETPAASQRKAERLTTTDALWKRLGERRHNRRLDLPKKTKREMQILPTNPPGRPNPRLPFVLKRCDTVSHGRRKLNREENSHHRQDKSTTRGRNDSKKASRFLEKKDSAE